jgi:DHA1 family bicyclomycin/chloramphenicol resistance-like MFS transporter
LGRGPGAFAILQGIGVAGFMLLATQSGRVSARIGPARAVQWGAVVQVVLCAALVFVSLVLRPTLALVSAFWCAFCGALAIRGPAASSQALALPPAQMGRASAMLVLAMLMAGALGTQVVAPFMSGRSVAPLAGGLLVFCAVSLALVVPYPRDKSV